MSDIYAHPAITSSPELILALQERLGLRAIIQGHRVRLVSIPPSWRYRSAPRGIEQRGHALVVVSHCADQLRDGPQGRPQ